MLLKPLFIDKETEAVRGEVPSHIARKLISGSSLWHLPTQRVEQS